MIRISPPSKVLSVVLQLLCYMGRNPGATHITSVANTENLLKLIGPWRQSSNSWHSSWNWLVLDIRDCIPYGDKIKW